MSVQSIDTVYAVVFSPSEHRKRGQ